jgi:hypothetical protein
MALITPDIVFLTFICDLTPALSRGERVQMGTAGGKRVLLLAE